MKARLLHRDVLQAICVDEQSHRCRRAACRGSVHAVENRWRACSHLLAQTSDVSSPNMQLTMSVRRFSRLAVLACSDVRRCNSARSSRRVSLLDFCPLDPVNGFWEIELGSVAVAEELPPPTGTAVHVSGGGGGGGGA